MESTPRKSYKAGTAKRWYLRAMTEEFDARHHPHGWEQLDFDDKEWLSATLLNVKADKPPVTGSSQTIFDFQANEVSCSLPMREIPMILEQSVTPQLIQRATVTWQIPREEFFDCYTENAYTAKILETPSDSVLPAPEKNSNRSSLLTFSFEHEVVGFPFISVKANEGTVLDILWAEYQHPDKVLLEQPRLNSRAIVTCHDSVTSWEALDFEAVKFLQVIASETSSDNER